MSLKVNCRKMALTYKTRKKYPCRCNRLCRKKIDNNAACTVPNRRIKIKDCTQFYLSVNFWKSLGIGGVKGMNGRAKAQGTRHKAQERSKRERAKSQARIKTESLKRKLGSLRSRLDQTQIFTNCMISGRG